MGFGYWKKGIRGMALAFLLVWGSAACTHALEEDEDAVAQLQTYLNEHGFDCGEVDGIMGEKTREAILVLQKSHGLPTTGDLTEELLSFIRGEDQTELVEMEPPLSLQEQEQLTDQQDEEDEEEQESFTFREGSGEESALTVSFTGPFTPEECEELALLGYEYTYGYRPLCEATVFENTGVITLYLYTQSENGEQVTLDWYTIDPETGKGTNMATEELDLSVYAALEERENIDVLPALSLVPEQAAAALGFAYSEPWSSEYGETGTTWYPEAGSDTSLFYYASQGAVPGGFSLEVGESDYHLLALRVGGERDVIRTSLLNNGYVLREEQGNSDIFVTVQGETVSADYEDGVCRRWYADGAVVTQ